MSFALYKSMMKSAATSILSYAVGSILYEWLIAWVYPTIAGNSKMNELLRQMPANLLKAFDLEKGVKSFGDYLAGEFFNLIWIILMAIFTVSLAVKLVSQMVDRGSMAFLLAAPLSRRKIILTQIAVLASGVILITVFTMAGAVLFAKVFSDIIDSSNFVTLGLIGSLFFLVVGGYSMIFSTVFDDSKRATGLAGGLTAVFYGMYMVGKLSDKVKWMQTWSLFNAFKPVDILNGTLEPASYIFGLGLAALVLFIIATVIFQTRDLSV
ncbi:MAG: ABC transporter permease subunit [Eubacteriales bacterium]